MYFLVCFVSELALGEGVLASLAHTGEAELCSVQLESGEGRGESQKHREKASFGDLWFELLFTEP